MTRYLIASPISDEGVEQIKNNIDDLGIKPDILRIYIDLQNISLGKYYDDNVINIYQSMDEKTASNMMLYELTNFMYEKLKKFRKIVDHNNIYFYLYSDKSRNKLNDHLIPGWKHNRKKSFDIMKKNDLKLHEAHSWLAGVYSASLTSAGKLLNTSPHCKLLMLKYLDSDFVPYLFILLDKILNYNTLHIITSNDHDYIHAIQENENVFRYFFLTKQDLNRVEHCYNVFQRVQKKLNLKTFDLDDYKFVTKYYQVFHALCGDSGDGFGSIIPRKSFVFWNKHLKNILKDITIQELRYKLLSENFMKKELEDLGVNFEVFLKRILVVDFYFFSLWILYPIIQNKIQGTQHEEIYNLSRKLLNMESRFIIDENIKIFRKIMNTKILPLNEAKKVLDFFNIKNSDIFAESMWYQFEQK